ncbi:type II toxin-antitoxin system RelE/ParE family toxin [Nitrosomonas sp. ANs5]|uniref:type II toxin-antitoxin system RelE/ParE family toxin n=1 Tax=Nitrosomonas sp. ANs5 TaxID=3423941 RepID=UPI003D331CC1
MRSPPSNHFEKLRGNLAGKHSIRINKQWRLGGCPRIAIVARARLVERDFSII